MLRSLYLGFALTLLSIIVAVFSDDIDLIVTISGGIGAISLLLAMIFSGSFLSGDNIRANFAIETKEDRRIRNNWTFRFALFAIPNLIAAIGVVYFTKFL